MMRRIETIGQVGLSVAAMVAIAACDPGTLPHCEDGRESCACTPGVAGTCNAGLLCDETVELCREPLACAQAACSAHQQCEPPTATTDAACLPACEPGYRWNEVALRCDAVDATCTPSLEAKCAASHRACTVPALGGDPYCGSCVDGFADENNECRPRVPCATILQGCEKKNRDCQESWFGPNEDARCGPCPDATTMDDSGVCRCDAALTKWSATTGACVPVKTCLDLDCKASGDVCVAAAGDKDAYCDEGCAEGFIWSAQTESCLPCPPCEDFPGTDQAAGVKGRIVNVTEDTCLCQTTPGYFFSGASQVGVFPCDADGDGWVRESARAAMYASEVNPAGKDRLKALKDNARCTVRKVTDFILKNDHGNYANLPAPEGGLLLFESDRNDDDKLLEADLVATNLNKPFGGALGTAAPGAGLPTAKQINRLTRYCHLAGSDYNDNGAADVSEWQGDAPKKSPKTAIKGFNQHSYFAELHTGEIGTGTGNDFAPTATLDQTANAPNEVKATFRIAERSRTASFPLTYGPGADPSWQTCTRKVDSRFEDVEVPAGIDFASSDGSAPVWSATWRGMTHSSQFRCLVAAVVADPQDTSQVGLGGPLSEWVFNQCTGTNDPATKAFTPSCAVIAATQIGVGHVGWAAAKYAPYHDTYANDPLRTRIPAAGSYARGCVDECAEIQQALRVPGKYGKEVAGLEFTSGLACALNPAWNGTADFECTSAASFGRLTGCSELCGDGLDTDGNLTTLDSVPTGPCGTGLPGVCAAGQGGCFEGMSRCKPTKAADPTVKDQCNGTDDDCDGVVDEDGADGVSGAKVLAGGSYVDAGASCTVGGAKGVCTAGKWGCSATGAGPECRSNIAPGSQKETCDGLDNNCDGTVDDSPQDTKIGQGCTVTDTSLLESGVIPGSACYAGAWQCTSGSLVCGPKNKKASESCNAVDDDCDGETDEGGVCDCDMLTGEIFFHGNVDNTYIKGTGDTETKFGNLEHTVTVTPQPWSSASPTRLSFAVELQVREFVGDKSAFSYKRTVSHDVAIAGDPMSNSEWYVNYDWAANKQSTVRWKKGGETITSCKPLWDGLPKGVKAVTAKAVAQPLTLRYIVSNPQVQDWVEDRVWDLYGSTEWKSGAYSDANGTFRWLPASIPEFSGNLPFNYFVAWAVDRFELMNHLGSDCDARKDYFAAYPGHIYLTSTGGNGTGTNKWCTVGGAKGILVAHDKATGGTNFGAETGFTVSWTAVPATTSIGFRRIRTQPGWGDNGSDHEGLFWQTWLRVPVTLTPNP